MKIHVLLASLGLLVASASWADVAGRVLVVSGEVSAVRDGKTLAAVQGFEIQTGDRLHVGERSALQIRFSDESVVSLRSNTEFKVDDYKFARNAENDRSFFSLLKGGMRTITGLIGKANQKSYTVRTETATIGVRGTHFVLLSCNNDCVQPDGSKAPDGLFGGVTDGKIFVSNDAGTTDFGQQEFFRVAGRNAAPERLLAPPGFLNEGNAGGRSRGNKGVGQMAAGVSSESQSGAAQVSNSPQSTQMPVVVTDVPSTATQYSANSLPGVVDLGSGVGVAHVESSGIACAGCTTSTKVISEELFGTIHFTYGTGNTNVSVPADSAIIASYLQSVGSTVHHDAASGVYWSYDAPTATEATAGYFGWHDAWGDVVTNMPTSGTASYNYVGGTAPTDSFGRTGTFTSSNLSVNFTSQQVTSLSPMAMSFGASGSVPATIFTFAPQSWSIGANGAQTMATTCSGCSGPSPVMGSVNGTFIGNGATGLAAAIAVASTVNVSVAALPIAAGTVAVFAKQ